MTRLLWLLGGLALGIGLALLIGWVWFPVEYYDTAPLHLRADYKNEYVRLVALTYQVEGNIQRARRRLSALNPDEPAAPLVDLTQQWIQAGSPASRIAPLAYLARDLGVATPEMSPYLQRGNP
ncbi:MAG: hypothetical protein JXA33_28485 [Anaerolineae bacterium]|nr:hypothetical protein [Anaerolineae bacterium]